MKKLPADFEYLKEMYADEYFPKFLVDKLRETVREIVSYLEKGPHSKKEVQKESRQSGDNTNPFSNTTEEKNESSVNTLSEYLHEPPCTESNFIILVRLYKSYPSNIDYEHHPELLFPPPEA